MRICFFETAQNLGGARFAAINMARNLMKIHEVSIYDLYGSCMPFVNACMNSGVQFSVIAPNENPHFIRSANSFIQKIWNLLTFIPHLIKMGKLMKVKIEEENIDYVCVSDFRPLLIFLFIKPRCKIVFFAHGWYIKNQLSFYAKFLLKNIVDKIVCISEATRHALYNEGIATLDRLFVVHNSISEERILTSPALIDNAEGKAIILHCGGFIRGKGQLISLKIAKRLKERGVNFKLVFAGILYQGNESIRYLETLKEYVKKEELDDNVLFVVGKSNVYDYMNACDILIHPSETEGFPLVIMEAQILGKPVVANAVGGVTDMVLNNYTGFIPNYNNIEEYCEVIIQLLGNKELYALISNNSYNLAKRCFTDHQQILDLCKVFSALS